MKWWDKILVGIGFCAAVFAIGSAVKQYRVESSIYELCENICINKIQREVPSPDDREKVIVFAHDCGAAGFPHTIVAIVRKSGGIPKHQPIEQRLAAAAWEGYCNVTILWRDNRTVVIEERGGGGDESDAPAWVRLKAITNGAGGIKEVLPMSLSESWE
jgi:hypothetical protein